jgi:Cft2 family RNA processing exonuclease
MFHYDRGLKLTKADLAIDFTRRQPRAFVSHAHSDHIARHEYAICTPETARLYEFRLGPRRTHELPYRQPIEWGGLTLTTFPAGHCLGSAMLLAEDEGRSLLYTGDFKIGPSRTSEPAELPTAEVLIMECTFGEPRYRMPPREEVEEELLEIVRAALAQNRPPVVEAYALGKSQEITCLLTDAGIPVMHHADVDAVSEVYRQCGVDLGPTTVYGDAWVPGCAVVAPPSRFRGRALPGLDGAVRIAVTGWAIDPAARYRLRVDHALPLSDHADFDELLEAAARVQPERIYCTHGPESFVDHLCEAGFDAHPLGRRKQKRLF